MVEQFTKTETWINTDELLQVFDLEGSVQSIEIDNDDRVKIVTHETNF